MASAIVNFAVVLNLFDSSMLPLIGLLLQSVTRQSLYIDSLYKPMFLIKFAFVDWT